MLAGYDTLAYTGYFYDAVGNLTKDSVAYYSSGVWQPGDLYLYSYNNDRLTTLSSYNFITASNSWQESYRTLVYYYSDNRIKTDTMYNISNGEAVGIDSFGWNPTVNYYTYRKHLSYGGGFYQFTDKKINSASGLPDTIYNSNISFNGIVLQKGREIFTYSNDGQPTGSKEYYASLTGSYDSLAIIHRYYYETYDTGSVTSPGGMTLYPNAADNYVIISFSGVAAGSTISTRLINAVGQTVMQYNYSYQNTPQRLSIPNVATGIYWLEAEDKNTRKVYKQAILKA